MTNEEYIRKGAALVGWTLDMVYDNQGTGYTESRWIQMMLDALAAQLVRQVDATGVFVVLHNPVTKLTQLLTPFGTYFDRPVEDWDEVGFAFGKNRTMNTIKAIVDSGVLEND